MNLGPGASNVNFAAYQINELNFEGYARSALQLASAGPSGQSQVVEASSNLFDWFPVLTNTVGTYGILEFSFTNGLVQPRQFFRIQTP